MRKIREYEKRLIEKILANVKLSSFKKNESCLMVVEIDDGNMGSIRFHSSNNDRCFGKEIGKIEFKDVDGVLVSAALSLDNYGDLYELDIWKTNFSPVIDFPL